MGEEGTSITAGDLPREVEGFRLLRILGKGGMGVVFEAEDIATGRRVALKVLTSERFDSDEARSRFQREARLAAALSHPHCVYVFGIHDLQGEPAIAMELMSGETLEDRVSIESPPSIEQAVDWAIEMLDGLEAAWKEGVIHRDVKPDNCFLDDHDHVKVGDFGLARTEEPDIKLTVTGKFVGSPVYAAPEQVRGRDVDHRADLYGVGATLYTLLTGQPPFTGRNAGEVLARVVSEKPEPVRTLRPEIPKGLERVLRKAMARKPGRRFRDHKRMRDALMPFSSRQEPAGGRAARFAAYIFDLTLVLLLLAWVDSFLEMHDAVVPSLLVLFFTMFDGFLRRTPGKALARLRVARSGSGSKPGLLHALVRTLVLHGLMFVSAGVANQFQGETDWLMFVIWPVVTCFTMSRKNGYRGVHEILSGTRVIDTGRERDLLLRPSRMPIAPAAPDSTPTTELGPYVVRGTVSVAGTELLAARDRMLDRDVWIRDRNAHRPDPPTGSPLPSAVRWLGSIDQDAKSFDVWEDPGGRALLDHVGHSGPLPWRVARPLLGDLSRICESSLADPERRTPAIEQLWIDAKGRLRLLDDALMSDSATHPDPIDFLRQAARLILLPQTPDSIDGPIDLPLHAEPVISSLVSSAETSRDAEPLCAELTSLADKSASRSHSRTGSMMTSFGLPLLLCGAYVLLAWFLFYLGAIVVVPRVALEDLDIKVAENRCSDRDAHMIFVSRAGSLRDRIEIFDHFLETRFPDEVDAMNRFPDPGPAEFDRAKRHLKSCVPEIDTIDPFKVGRSIVARFLAPPGLDDPLDALYHPGLAAAFFGFPLSVLAFLLRGSLGLRFRGLALRDRRGRHASRLRCLYRSLLTWVPIALPLFLVGRFRLPDHAPTAVLVLTALLLLGFLANLLSALVSPERSLIDRLAGTRVVPR